MRYEVKNSGIEEHLQLLPVGAPRRVGRTPPEAVVRAGQHRPGAATRRTTVVPSARPATMTSSVDIGRKPKSRSPTTTSGERVSATSAKPHAGTRPQSVASPGSAGDAGKNSQ